MVTCNTKRQPTPQGKKGVKYMTYPRVYVSEKTHARFKRLAKKRNLPMKAIGDKVVLAGLRATEAEAIKN